MSCTRCGVWIPHNNIIIGRRDCRPTINKTRGNQIRAILTVTLWIVYRQILSPTCRKQHCCAAADAIRGIGKTIRKYKLQTHLPDSRRWHGIFSGAIGSASASCVRYRQGCSSRIIGIHDNPALARFKKRTSALTRSISVKILKNHTRNLPVCDVATKQQQARDNE